jgi:hypothetical protein
MKKEKSLKRKFALEQAMKDEEEARLAEVIKLQCSVLSHNDVVFPFDNAR